MVRLVIFRGAQYDAANLPAHVVPSECVPIDEWRALNRRVKTRPTMDAQPVKRAAKKKTRGS